VGGLAAVGLIIVGIIVLRRNNNKRRAAEKPPAPPAPYGGTPQHGTYEFPPGQSPSPGAPAYSPHFQGYTQPQGYQPVPQNQFPSYYTPKAQTPIVEAPSVPATGHESNRAELHS
jgi:hypothetical protein